MDKFFTDFFKFFNFGKSRQFVVITSDLSNEFCILTIYLHLLFVVLRYELKMWKPVNFWGPGFGVHVWPATTIQVKWSWFGMEELHGLVFNRKLNADWQKRHITVHVTVILTVDWLSVSVFEMFSFLAELKRFCACRVHR